MTRLLPVDDRPRRAFQTAADPNLFFDSASCAETYGRLLSAVESDPLAILTGEPGAGKTSLLRRLMGELEATGIRSIMCGVPIGLDELRTRLPAAEPGRRVVLGLDEAQDLSVETLTTLPALLAARPDVRILLVGQPGLEDELTALEADGTVLPASVRCRLAPLDAREVGPYIEHRWQKGSEGPNPFPPSVVRRIAHVSAGIPQMVNLLSFHALRLAEARGQEMVSEKIVGEVERDLARIGSAHRVRPLRRVVIVPALAVSLVIVSVALVLRPGMRGREQPVERPPIVRTERVSLEPAAVAVRPPNPDPAPSEPKTHVLAVRPPNPDPAPSKPKTYVRPAARERVPQTAPLPVRAASSTRFSAAVTVPAAGTHHAPATGEALLYRSEEGDLQAIRTLLDEGASPGARDPAGFTPLMLAAIHGHPEIVELLIARGAGVNAQNRAGLTPLMLAAINNHPAVLRMLLGRSADPHARTKAGWTALTYAAWRGYPDIVRLLLARGADPNVTDRQGWTALQYVNWHAAQPASSDGPSDMPKSAEPLRVAAAGPGHAEVIALLRQAGAKP